MTANQPSRPGSSWLPLVALLVLAAGVVGAALLYRSKQAQAQTNQPAIAPAPSPLAAALPTSAPATVPSDAPHPAPKTSAGVAASPLGAPPSGHVPICTPPVQRIYPKEVIVPDEYVTVKTGRYQVLSFAQLAAYRIRIKYVTDDSGNLQLATQRVSDQIPKAIMALSGHKVGVRGFMYPVELDDRGQTTHFMLLETIPTCLYCQPPLLNEWVEVTNKTGVAPTDRPVIVYGTIDIGEKLEEGVVASIYRMDSVEVVPAPDH